MSTLLKLSISGLRNLEQTTLEFSPGFNLVYGENGSGKTSLLEAIFLLGRNKTFRSASRAPIIQFDSEQCVIHGDLDDELSLGFSRAQNGEQLARVNGKNIKTQAELVEKLPLQLINADAFKIIEGGPAVRRAFLDWGVFHVEHSFIRYWHLMQRALANRNSLLKRKELNRQEIAPWTQEFCKHAEEVHKLRMEHMAKLCEQVEITSKKLLPGMEVDLAYEKGWDESSVLEDVLSSRLEQDKKYGHSGAGPQRADLKISINGVAAAELLSRGQQKLLVIAMKLAQAGLLAESSQKHSLFLIDDLPAELDAANRDKVLEILAQRECQVFVTGIDAQTLILPLREQKELRLFHVKHGKILPSDTAEYFA